MSEWDNNIISFELINSDPDQGVQLGDAERWAANEVRAVVVASLPRFMASFFEHLDDALFDFADKHPGGDSANYLGAMRDIRKARANLEQQFSEALLGRYDAFWSQGPSEPTASHKEADLSLVEAEDLEENLAVSNMVAKAENRYHLELFAIERRFGHMMGEREVTNRTNPVAPAAFGEAFRLAAQDLPVDTLIRVVTYKLFDKQVLGYVGGMFDEINSLLGRIGILPNLTPKIQRNPVAPPLRKEIEREERIDRAAQGAATDLESGVFGALRALLEQRRGGETPTTAGVRVETASVLNVLSELQQQDFVGVTSEGEVRREAEQLKRKLFDGLRNAGGPANGSLSAVDTDTIDVIGMLFEFILGDPNLPDAMKALLGRLQIPMVKVALLDKSFFNKPDHPARRLLNKLARAAAAWFDDGDRSQNSLYGQIERVVNRVLVEYRKDGGLFAELDAAFGEYIERERHSAEVAEERIRQVTRGKEQLESAKQRVADEVGTRCASAHLPEVVIRLLEDGWKDVLLLTYLRQGPESEAWFNALGLMDKLVWSVQIKTAYQERQELLRCIPGMLDALRSGLNGISFDAHKMGKLFKELQACHIACLRDGADPRRRASALATGAAVEPPADNESAADSEEQAVKAEWDEARRRVEELQEGTWFEFSDNGARPVRAKLVWRSDISGVRLFVDRRGGKVLEAEAEELAERLRGGTMRLLVDIEAPLIDRAMESLVEQLKQDA
jgi:hypothetical protein